MLLAIASLARLDGTELLILNTAPATGQNLPKAAALTRQTKLWQCPAMLRDAENQLSLTRAASSTGGRQKAISYHSNRKVSVV